jgi:hypothetical protein
MAKTKDKKVKKIHYPDYTLDGKASKPSFFNRLGKLICPPKNYKPKVKTWD